MSERSTLIQILNKMADEVEERVREELVTMISIYPKGEDDYARSDEFLLRAVEWTRNALMPILYETVGKHEEEMKRMNIEWEIEDISPYVMSFLHLPCGDYHEWEDDGYYRSDISYCVLHFFIDDDVVHMRVRYLEREGIDAYVFEFVAIDLEEG